MNDLIQQLPWMRNYVFQILIAGGAVVFMVILDMILLLVSDGKVEFGDGAWLATGGLATVLYEHAGKVLTHYIGDN